MKLWEPISCCGFTPRTGTLVLGYMGAIGSALQLLGMIRYVFLGRETFKEICWEIGVNVDSCSSSIITGLWIGIAMQILWGFACYLLTLGSKEGETQLMLPYMILQAISLVGFTLGLVVGLILMMYYKLWIAVLITIPIGGLFLFLTTYFLLVVRVHYMEIKERKTSPGIEFNRMPNEV